MSSYKVRNEKCARCKCLLLRYIWMLSSFSFRSSLPFNTGILLKVGIAHNTVVVGHGHARHLGRHLPSEFPRHSSEQRQSQQPIQFLSEPVTTQLSGRSLMDRCGCGCRDTAGFRILGRQVFIKGFCIRSRRLICTNVPDHHIVESNSGVA